jgi:uncharacterized membrane protein
MLNFVRLIYTFGPWPICFTSVNMIGRLFLKLRIVQSKARGTKVSVSALVFLPPVFKRHLFLFYILVIKPRASHARQAPYH